MGFLHEEFRKWFRRKGRVKGPDLWNYREANKSYLPRTGPTKAIIIPNLLWGARWSPESRNKVRILGRVLGFLFFVLHKSPQNPILSMNDD